VEAHLTASPLFLLSENPDTLTREENSMKRSAVLMVLVLLCSIAATPSHAQDSPDVVKAITDLEYKWADAQKNGKPDIVAPLLADRFVNTDTDGKVSGRDTLLANLKGGKWEHNGISDVKVIAFGHVAIATGAWAGKGVDGDGTKIDRRERWTDTWVRMPGGLWQCVASQQTELRP
jgi:ketosteroid isomerase-like protein